MGCAKCIVILFNVLLLLIGLGVIAVGVVLKFNLTAVTQYIPPDVDVSTIMNLAPIGLMVKGGIIVAVAIFGICVAAKENSCGMKFYATIVTIAALVVIAVTVMLWVCKADYASKVAQMGPHWADKPEMVVAFQDHMSCCGFDTIDTPLVNSTYCDVHRYDAGVPTCQAVIDNLLAAYLPVGVIVATVAAGVLFILMLAACCLCCRKTPVEASSVYTYYS